MSVPTEPSSDLLRVRVLFFARARDLARRDSAELSVPRSSTISDAVSLLSSSYPDLAPLLPNCRFAVDQEFASSSTPLSHDSELAVLPPVSGG